MPAKNGNGQHAPPHPALTSTTTPAGIAANDPDVERPATTEELTASAWATLRAQLRDVMHLPKGTVKPADHLDVVTLVDRDGATPEQYRRATQLVRKYLPDVYLANFPGESPPTKVDRLKRDAEIFGAASAALRKELGARSQDSAVASASSAPLREDPPAENLSQRRGGAENGEAAKTTAAETTALSRVSLAHCIRHPDNRVPAPADVEALAESIEREGLLEPPVVRRFRGQWQIVSGETRILALRKLGRQGEIDAHVIECDDARALELVAVYNAKRRDLNAIEKARMIDRLCQDMATKGGAGMTREQAAQVYDLESGAAASNLVRLLQLPDVFQKRVASGELPWTFARELLPYAHAPKLMDAFDVSWRQSYGPKGEDWMRDQWENRQHLAEHIWHVIHKNTRPMDGQTKHHFEHDVVGEFGVYEPRLFAVTDELRAKLGVVTLEVREHIASGKVRKLELATDAKLWDKLNLPLVKQKLAKKTKSKAAKAGREDAPPKHVPTAAELKLRAQQQAAQLGKRIDLWRHRWLADLIGRRIDDNVRLRELLVVWFLEERPLTYSGNSRLHHHHPPLHKLLTMSEKSVYDAGSSYAHSVLVFDAETDFPRISATEINALAAVAGIDLAHEWADMQRLATIISQENLVRARYESFFELHQTAQLDSLGKELGVHTAHVSGKAAKIKLLTGCTRTLKLPKSIKPVVGVKKAGKQKAAKGTK